jgi:hypothetical protein
LAELAPAIGKFAGALSGHEDKAKAATAVAADPNAPPAVKQAAANIASQAIDDKAAVEKAAVGAVAGKAPRSESAGMSSTTMVVIGLGALLLLGKRR